jgi:SAM-dependent methyltransferase
MDHSTGNKLAFAFAEKLIREAEVIAHSTSALDEVLPALRKLSMEDFSRLLMSMPNSDYPALSKVLPRMASKDIQIQWTGTYGEYLLAQTVAFARIVETAYVRHTGKPLQDKTVVDFGVGYGRNARSMMYYTDPQNIYGVDAWDGSLDLSRIDGMPCHLLLSEPFPEKLPVKDKSIDLIISFSVFTHLSASASSTALDAMKIALKKDGVAAVTIRPQEYWNLDDQTFDKSKRHQLLSDHENDLIAFSAHTWSHDGSYGDSSIDLRYFERHGWRVLGYETTMTDKYQITAIIKPA